MPPKRRTEWEHGTRTGYQKGCRCEPCVTANGHYMASWRRSTGRTKASTIYVPNRYLNEAEHGTRAKYVGGCRCEPCTVANRAYQRSYMRLHRAGTNLTDPLIEEALRS